MLRALPHDPVILGAFRTPIGKHGGILSSIRPDDMLALLMKEALTKLSLSHLIDEVVIGCANQAGEDNRNIARMATLLAGLSETIPGITLNRLCASGLDAVIDGARRIITGEAELVVTGGVESMSRAPYVMGKMDSPYQLGAPSIFDSSLGWRFFNKKMESRTLPEHNGLTAERLVEKYGISRNRQDQFALMSHKRSIASQESGFFEKEILPISLKDKRGETIAIKKDEGPRIDTSLEKLATLKPAFKDNGSVTAGNSSSLNDGAALVIISSHAFAKSHCFKPLVRLIGFATAGVDPRIMGIGPVPATLKLLKNTHLRVHDFDTIEINEAFAAQVLSVVDELKLDEERVNPRGGAIALGHPLGCSGARIVATMINHMQHSQAALGLATMCVGVGQGISLAVEAIN